MLAIVFRSSLMLALLGAGAVIAAEDKELEYIAFVGTKISLDYVPRPDDGKRYFYHEYLARYNVVEVVYGSYENKEIEFSAFDHYGRPAFGGYNTVLLYVVKDGDRFFHPKYQFSPLLKTVDGQWAAPYPTKDYNHSYNVDTPIKPVKLEFAESFSIDVSDMDRASRKRWYPKPYYEIRKGKAYAKYGNFIPELLRLKQSGVMKARGQFQESAQ